MSYDWRWLSDKEVAELGLAPDRAWAQTEVAEGFIRVPVERALVGGWNALASELQVMFADGHAELRGEGHD